MHYAKQGLATEVMMGQCERTVQTFKLNEQQELNKRQADFNSIQNA